MNRGQINTALQLRLGVPITGDGLLTSTAIYEAIRSALVDISSDRDWPWLLTSASLSFTAGVASMPAALVKVRELYVNSARAKHANLAEYLDALAGNGQRVWTEVGTSIKLAPVPATAPTATLYYITAEPALANDAASPLLPEAHQQVLLARAAYYCELRRNRPEAAQFLNNEYEMGLKRMQDAQHTTTGPRRVRDASAPTWATW